MANDYLFRGISQTDNHPEIQGSLQYGYEPWGVYLGNWASSVNTMTRDGEIEIRWFGGLRGEFAVTLPKGAQGQQRSIKLLKRKATAGKITLIYATRDEEHNSALILKRFLQKG